MKKFQAMQLGNLDEFTGILSFASSNSNCRTEELFC